MGVEIGLKSRMREVAGPAYCIIFRSHRDATGCMGASAQFLCCEFSNLSICGANPFTTFQFTAELPATSGERLAAGSLGVSAPDAQKIPPVTFWYGGCEVCPCFHGMWQCAIDWRNKGKLFPAVPDEKTNFVNRHWNITQIRDYDAVSMNGLDTICTNKKFWLNSNPNLVTVESSPSIHNPESCTKKSEAYSGNCGYQCDAIFVE